MFEEEFKQIRKNAVLMLIVVSLGIAVLTLIMLAHNFYGIPVSDFTRDPAAIMNAPFYVGFLSTLGIFFWTSCASITIFTSIIRKGIYSKFLLYCGVFTTMLLLDDMFMLHEYFFPVIIGINEKVLFLGYGLIIGLIFNKYKKVILETDYAVLVFAVMFFGLSLFIDLLPENILPVHHIFEDGSKFIGIILWWTYFVKTSSKSMNKNQKK